MVDRDGPYTGLIALKNFVKSLVSAYNWTASDIFLHHLSSMRRWVLGHDVAGTKSGLALSIWMMITPVLVQSLLSTKFRKSDFQWVIHEWSAFHSRLLDPLFLLLGGGDEKLT